MPFAVGKVVSLAALNGGRTAAQVVHEHHFPILQLERKPILFPLDLGPVRTQVEEEPVLGCAPAAMIIICMV